MKKLLKILFLAFLILTLGSFSKAFASTNTNLKDTQNTNITLTLFMQDSTKIQYTITRDEFTKFTNWYNLRANGGTLLNSYTFNLSTANVSTDTKAIVFFNTIECFEIYTDTIPAANRNTTLSLSMKNSTIRKYSLTQDELNKFNHWYNLRANGGTLQSYYIFNIPANKYSPDRKDYVLFNNISSLEIH
ncbi:hypothetical protein KYB31_02990 [Clostridium felsineum]|uniref:hypothetical protein n=1 Tax=Clostridium felsineum TaxID=36839 RepID=UPI00214D3F5A|nr:hypothetical protein [Clostridium felsineum]MCR3757964.1 hypothetical protein [Clostridium felsineum]